MILDECVELFFVDFIMIFEIFCDSVMFLDECVGWFFVDFVNIQGILMIF